MSRNLPSLAIDAPHRWVHYLLLLVVAIGTGWSHGPLQQPITFDNQLYYYVSERVASGVPPHVSLVDHKHALPSIITGFAIAAGRVIGMDDVLAARLCSIVFAALVPIGVWIVGFGITRNAIVAHLSAFITLTFDDFYLQAAMGLRPQIFMAGFMSMALAMLSRRRAVLSGAFAAAAFLSWQPALLAAASIFAALALTPRPLPSLIRFAVGFLLVFLPYEIYFYLYGALGEQITQSFRMAGDIGAYKRPTIADSLRFILRDSHWGIGYRILIPAAYLLFLAGLAIEIYARPRAALEHARSSPVTTATVICGVLTLTFTFIDHQAYPDRYFVQPFIALANGIPLGYALTRVITFVARSDVARLRVSATVFLAGVISLLTLKEPTRFVEHAYTLDSQRILADRMDDLRARYGSLWVVGCVHLLGLKREQNFDSVGMVIDPRVRAYALASSTDGSYRPKNGEMPNVILLSRGGEAKIFHWLPREYRRFDDKAFKLQGIVVWIRENCVTREDHCADPLQCQVLPTCRGGPPATSS